LKRERRNRRGERNRWPFPPIVPWWLASQFKEAIDKVFDQRIAFRANRTKAFPLESGDKDVDTVVSMLRACL
jgi:hypothetical protein